MLIKIAGVPFEVRCEFKEENREFFKEYLTEDEPLFTIEPTEEDRIKIQNGFDRMAEGTQKIQYTKAFLENNAIHALMAEKMVEYNTLLMHGSALCMDGDGYIFTAPSGTGKSTHARLWREAFGDRVWMINDDKPMLRIDDNGVAVYGTPWDGKHRLSRNASAPLKAIVLLSRSESNKIEPLSKAEAFRLMLKQAYISEKASTTKAIAEMENELVAKVAFYHLHCNMQPEAAMIAWKGMNEGNPRS